MRPGVPGRSVLIVRHERHSNSQQSLTLVFFKDLCQPLRRLFFERRPGIIHRLLTKLASEINAAIDDPYYVPNDHFFREYRKSFAGLKRTGRLRRPIFYTIYEHQ